MDFEALRTISDETEQIRQTYTLFREETRLFASKAAQVEFLTTVHYIERYQNFPENRGSGRAL